MYDSNSRQDNYLHECRRLHPVVTKLRYGRTQDLQVIEQATKEIRKRRKLTYDDIEKIRSSEVWDADQFGYWPRRSEIESSLNSRHLPLWNRRPDSDTAKRREAETINHLLRIFHQIETVSVILRYVNPKHYGILSPPVELVLGVGPSRRHSEKYMAYLENLRSLKVTHGFQATADVDMALWVLQLGVVEERLKDHLNESDYLNLRDGLEQDRVLRDIRMANLARQLFQGIPRLDLARALANAEYLEIAGQIAGCELERRVANRLSIAPDSDMKLREMIDEAWSDRGSKYKYHRAVNVRNQAVHCQEVTKEEVESLIKAVESVKAYV